MKKKEIIVIGILIVAVFSVALYSKTKDLVQYPEVCFDETCFDISIAANEATRRVGLMNVTNLSDNEGMLFIFDDPGHYPFWMFDTKIPLDIIWMDENLTVTFIHENAEPCVKDEHPSYPNCPTIDPGAELLTLYVLEINGGLTSEKGIEVGDTARCKNFVC